MKHSQTKKCEMKKRGKDKDLVKKMRRFNGNTLTQMDFFDDDEAEAGAKDGAEVEVEVEVVSPSSSSAKNVTPSSSGKKRKKVEEEPPFTEPSYIEETLIIFPGWN